MLFSSRETADFINATYEPAWESVRPAPLVTIDFGNGHVVKRTLQGNIATYVCGPDGTVYDVLPGIYTPDVYRAQLKELRKLADSLRPYVATRSKPTENERKRAALTVANRLREYHKLSEARLAAPAVQAPTPQMQSIAGTGGGFKGGFGGGFQALGFGGQPQPLNLQPQAITGTGGAFKGGAFAPPSLNFGNGGGFQFTGSIGGFQSPQPRFSGIEGPVAQVVSGAPPPTVVNAAPAGELAARPELKLDTEVNERIRRKAVHAHLANMGTVQPNDIKKWLFREVLHADLDDPKLGLGKLLDSNYPFAAEDRALRGKPKK